MAAKKASKRPRRRSTVTLEPPTPEQVALALASLGAAIASAPSGSLIVTEDGGVNILPPPQVAATLKSPAGGPPYWDDD